MKLLDEGLVRNVILFTGSLHMNNDEETFILARKSVLLLQAEAIKYLDDKLLPLFKSSPFFLKMLSTPDIISTDIYVHFLTMSSSDNNAKQNKAIRETTKIDFMNPVRIFANPGITDALDNIVNGSDLKLDKAKKAQTHNIHNCLDQITIISSKINSLTMTMTTPLNFTSPRISWIYRIV